MRERKTSIFALIIVSLYRHCQFLLELNMTITYSMIYTLIVSIIRINATICRKLIIYLNIFQIYWKKVNKIINNFHANQECNNLLIFVII